MKTKNILTLSALVASMSFAADAPSISPVDHCKLALDNAKTTLPANAISARSTLAEGYGALNQLETVYADDDDSSADFKTSARHARIVSVLEEQSAGFPIAPEVTFGRDIAKRRFLESATIIPHDVPDVDIAA